ncbi:MAG TPA: DUF2884 family protein [Stenotrophomonas sp.]|nr:DUF2884 family protein [Stenotrophomonas sp.]
MKWHHWIALALLALSTTAGAEPARPQLSSRLCSYSTPYDLRVGNDGVWLARAQGQPREVHIHDGGISIDQRAQDVSAADGLRLRHMEAMTRELVPAVAGVARDAVDIAFDALAGVVQVLSGSPAKARDVERFRRQAQAQIDDSLGQGRWDQKAFDARFEASVERAAEDMAASLSRHVLWAVFSGRSEEMERRSEQMEKDLDARMEARSRALETRAQSLCSQVAALHDMQQELELRYQGQRLQLLVPSPDDGDDDRGGIAASSR